MFLFVPFFWQSQIILVGPYLQDANPTSINVMWETSLGQQSLVEYGTTTSLGSSASGNTTIGFGLSQVHDTKIDGLLPNTKYYYRVKTLAATSPIYDFVTPPNPLNEKAFNIVAMSDMQQDAQHPNVFSEIVNQQLIPFVNNRYGNDLAQNLAYVFIPGDLVSSGNNYFSWKSSFFDPAKELFYHVPVYPVAGNHEDDSQNYFRYFHLPENGTNSSNYKEHWWYKDYSNVRLIGLESNSGYRVQQQLDWLQSVLNDAATDSTIDFVFAQLHHPHKSELWIAGNTDYTGDIIQLLEGFSESSSKPSAHFFGHTHGYSRGQSKNHNHLMVNVATAGGAIDNWGEFAQQDYKEFSKSDDDYGFVLLEVEAGPNPQFLLSRVSHGSYENGLLNNVITDTVRIKKYNNPPIKPIGIFPSNGSLLNPKCIVFSGSSFIDPDADLQGASHWQISEDSLFNSVIYDEWIQHENWYFDQDLLSGNDMTKQEVKNLEENKTYYWRLRYRDRSLFWSDWSEFVAFQTKPSSLTPNLLSNGGAENGTISWIEQTGAFESILSGECSGNMAFSGNRLFAVGGVCNENAYAEGSQEIDVSTYQSLIDSNSVSAVFGGYLSNYNGNDIPSLKLEFYNANNILISTSQTYSNQTPNWTLVTEEEMLPLGTKKIKIILMGTRNAGSDNDSYFDEVFLKLNLHGIMCEEAVLSTGKIPIKTPPLLIYPNPFQKEISFKWNNPKKELWRIEILDVHGRILEEKASKSDLIIFEAENDSKGHYFYRFYVSSELIKTGKIIQN